MKGFPCVYFFRKVVDILYIIQYKVLLFQEKDISL